MSRFGPNLAPYLPMEPRDLPINHPCESRVKKCVLCMHGEWHTIWWIYNNKTHNHCIIPVQYICCGQHHCMPWCAICILGTHGEQHSGQLVTINNSATYLFSLMFSVHTKYAWRAAQYSLITMHCIIEGYCNTYSDQHHYMPWCVVCILGMHGE